MKYFLLILAGLYGLDAKAVSRKFQVCTMTMSSVEEARLFRQHLPPQHFEFFELAEEGLHDFSERQSGQWLERACGREELKCDVLIISGHFAGMFFGTENDHVLSVYELEKMACRRQCPRVFSHLKEAFLFGCNTMAHKDQIQRTPEEYLRVLLEYNLPQNEAEIAVAGRFSNLGVTYKTRMEHIFYPQTKIYGFTEKSPLGSQVSGVLNKYLSSVQEEYGSYYNYLVQRFYNNESSHFFNRHFHNAFSQISSVQQSYGMTAEHPRYKNFSENLSSLFGSRELCIKNEGCAFFVGARGWVVCFFSDSGFFNSRGFFVFTGGESYF